MAEEPHGWLTPSLVCYLLCFSLQEYSGSQLKALVNSGFGTRTNKKAKQRLIQIIDDMDKRK